jgi:hypothetical protein
VSSLAQEIGNDPMLSSQLDGIDGSRQFQAAGDLGFADAGAV